MKALIIIRRTHQEEIYFDPPAVNACFLAAKVVENTLFSFLGQLTN
jgi:hypothetical protein